MGMQAAQPAAARGPGAELRFQSGGATSSGPAAGLGYEIILQAFNWESHREKWYQVDTVPALNVGAAVHMGWGHAGVNEHDACRFWTSTAAYQQQHWCAA